MPQCSSSTPQEEIERHERGPHFTFTILLLSLVPSLDRRWGGFLHCRAAGRGFCIRHAAGAKNDNKWKEQSARRKAQHLKSTDAPSSFLIKGNAPSAPSRPVVTMCFSMYWEGANRMCIALMRATAIACILNSRCMPPIWYVITRCMSYFWVLNGPCAMAASDVWPSETAVSRQSQYMRLPHLHSYTH